MAGGGYAQSQGMTLLNRVVEQVGPLFTTEEAKAAAAALNLPPERVRALLSQLAQARWIERLKRGSYAVTTPIFGTTLHPYAVATALISPLAIRHWSALAHHGFTFGTFGNGLDQVAKDQAVEGVQTVPVQETQ